MRVDNAFLAVALGSAFSVALSGIQSFSIIENKKKPVAELYKGVELTPKIMGGFVRIALFNKVAVMLKPQPDVSFFSCPFNLWRLRKSYSFGNYADFLKIY